MASIFRRFHRKELFLIFLFFVLFLLLRSLHFAESLNFSYDQAAWSTRALEIYRNSELTLVGPEYSLDVAGRKIFQGPATYYFLILFLVPARFDPVFASYLFTIFAGLSVFPLFFGSKFLFGRKGAVLITAFYVLFPLFVDYTRFLWNGNFIVAVSAFIIFFLGLFYKTGRRLFVFLAFLTGGILVQMHYLFLIVLAGLGIFLFLQKRLILQNFFVLIFGFLLGLISHILFEARNGFYTFKTLLIYAKNYRQLVSGSGFENHYFLVLSVFVFLLAVFLFKKFIDRKVLVSVVLILSFVDLFLYLPKPSHGFGMSENWSYPDEVKTYEIIRSKNISNYNIANLVYDTKATVQKYLHAKDDIKNEGGNYETNKYLFVISRNLENFNDFPYEVKYFFPHETVGEWEINEAYNLFLLERL